MQMPKHTPNIRVFTAVNGNTPAERTQGEKGVSFFGVLRILFHVPALAVTGLKRTVDWSARQQMDQSNCALELIGHERADASV